MNALALATLVVIAGVGGCEPMRATHDAPEPTSSSPVGAGPGGLLPSVCVGQDDVRTWERVDPATVDWKVPDSWRGSQCAWSVTMQNGVPIVFARDSTRDTPRCPEEDSSGQRCSVRRGRAGVLVGHDGGEWGGELSWRATHGSFRRLLLDRNVIDILPAGTNFIALTYLGHGSEPRAVEVFDTGTRFEVGRAVDLPGLPTATAVQSDGNILVAAGRSLLRLSRNLQTHQLLENLPYHSVSLTIASPELVYLGMYGVVVELNMSATQPTQTWLYPF